MLLEAVREEALRFISSVLDKFSEKPDADLDAVQLLKLAWEKAEVELGPQLRAEKEAAAKAKREADKKAAVAEAAKKKVAAWTEKKEREDKEKAEEAARQAVEKEAREEAARAKAEKLREEAQKKAQRDAAMEKALEAKRQQKAEETAAKAAAKEMAEAAKRIEEAEQREAEAILKMADHEAKEKKAAEKAAEKDAKASEAKAKTEAKAAAKSALEIAKAAKAAAAAAEKEAARAQRLAGMTEAERAEERRREEEEGDEGEEGDEEIFYDEASRKSKVSSSASNTAAARLERSTRRLSSFIPLFKASDLEENETDEQRAARLERLKMADWQPDPSRVQLCDAWRGGATLGKEMDCSVAWPPEGLFMYADCLVADARDDTLMCMGSDGDATSVSTYSSTLGPDLCMLGHEEAVCSVAMNGELIASGSVDGTIRIWSRSQGECFAVLTGCLGMPLGLAMTEGLLMSGEDLSPEDEVGGQPDTKGGGGGEEGDAASHRTTPGRAHLWSLREIMADEPGADEAVAEYGEHEAAICSVALGEMVAISAGSKDQTARVWPLSRRGSPESNAVLRHPAGVNSVSINFASSLAATGCGDGNVWLWSLSTYTSVRIFDHTGSDSITPVSCVRLVDDMLVSGGQDGHVKVWSIVSHGECITTIAKAVGTSYDGPDTIECVQAVAASAFGYIAVAGGDKLVIWRPTNAPAAPPPPPPKPTPARRRSSLFGGKR